MELQPMDAEGGRSERAKWLLNPSNQPVTWMQKVKRYYVFSGLDDDASQLGRLWPSRLVALVEGLFPIVKWGVKYKAGDFKNDLMAGLTLASLSIPQSIGYANLAKLHPQYGLYTSAVPPIIYAVMGSSREIAIGPVAVVSLLLSATVSKIVDPAADPAAYTKLIFTVTFFAGAFQALFGFFRLGFLVDFLSHAATVGFMGGAAIVIGLQQLRGLLGISHFTTKTDVVSVLGSVSEALHHQWYPLNMVIGCSFLTFILLSRFLGKRKRLLWLPALAPLLSVIFSTLLVYVTKADRRHGVKILKHFKAGINPISLGHFNLAGPTTKESLKIGFISAIIALAEAIAVGRSFASINGYHLDGNKEMTAMGFMNIIGSFTSCYVATGSFSRTAVNFSAGCKTAVSNIVMSITVMICLMLFTRLMYYTPLAILASIILSALPGLVDVGEACHIWKVDKLDFLVCIGAFFGVLFCSVETGLLIALGISVGKIVVDSIRPRTEVVGRLPGTLSIYCNLLQFPAATRVPGLLILRINSPTFCFANATSVRQRILRLVTYENDTKGGIHSLVLDMTNVMSIDTSSIRSMEELLKSLVSMNIVLAIANPKWEVISKMKDDGLMEKIGPDHVFMCVEDAVEASFHFKMNA